MHVHVYSLGFLVSRYAMYCRLTVYCPSATETILDLEHDHQWLIGRCVLFRLSTRSQALAVCITFDLPGKLSGSSAGGAKLICAL